MKLSSVAWVKIDEAVRRDDVGTLGELIFFREAWQRRDPRTGETVLGMAAASGAVECSRALLAAGADPNFGGACSPLGEAAAKGHTQLFQLLLEAGANPDERDADGGLPIEFAVAANASGIVDVLRERGWFARARPGLWAWMIETVRERSFGATARALSLALPSTLPRGLGRRSLRLLMETVAQGVPGVGGAALDQELTALQSRLTTLLLTRTEFALEVIERNVDEVRRQLNLAPSRQRRQWAGYALALALQDEWADLANEMLSLAELDCEMRTQWNKGYTPLMVAVWMGRLDVVEQLLERGADSMARAEGPTGERTLDLRHFAEISSDRAGAREFLARHRSSA